MLKVTAMLRVVAELEDICDCGYRLVMLAERKYRKRRALPPETIKQVEQFAKIVLQFMDFYSSRIVRGVEMQDMETAYQLENTIDRFRNTGGFDIIGSGRTKLESVEDFQKALETASASNLTGLVVIGGDDSN